MCRLSNAVTLRSCPTANRACAQVPVSTAAHPRVASDRRRGTAAGGGPRQAAGGEEHAGPSGADAGGGPRGALQEDGGGHGGDGRAAGGPVRGGARDAAGGDRAGRGRDGRPGARRPGGPLLQRPLRLLLPCAAVRVLRGAPAVRAAAQRVVGRRARDGGGACADRVADPGAVAVGAHRGARRQRLLPRGDHGVVRGVGGGLRVRAAQERAPGGHVGGVDVRGAGDARGDGRAAAGVRRPVLRGAQLVAAAAGGGEGGAQRPRRQPALRGDVGRHGGDGLRGAPRGLPLHPRRHGEPHRGAAARHVRGPHLDGADARQPGAPVLRVVRLRADADAAPGRAGGDRTREGAVRHHPRQGARGRRPGAGQRAPGLAVVRAVVAARGAARRGARQPADDAAALPGSRAGRASPTGTAGDRACPPAVASRKSPPNTGGRLRRTAAPSVFHTERRPGQPAKPPPGKSRGPNPVGCPANARW